MERNTYTCMTCRAAQSALARLKRGLWCNNCLVLWLLCCSSVCLMTHSPQGSVTGNDESIIINQIITIQSHFPDDVMGVCCHSELTLSTSYMFGHHYVKYVKLLQSNDLMYNFLHHTPWLKIITIWDSVAIIHDIRLCRFLCKLHTQYEFQSTRQTVMATVWEGFRLFAHFWSTQHTYLLNSKYCDNEIFLSLWSL